MGDNFGCACWKGMQETGNQEKDSQTTPVTVISATETTPSAEDIVDSKLEPETSLKEDDNVSELFDKDLGLKTNIIVQLDIDSKEEEKLSSFAIDLKRVLAAGTSPFEEANQPSQISTQIHCECEDDKKLKPDSLKEQTPSFLEKRTSPVGSAEDTSMDDLIKQQEIDESLLSGLSSHAALMCDVIRPKLNKAGNDLLYKLAESFQEDGYLKEVDINTFIVSESYESPTVKMMDYIVCSLPIQYKIQDLVDRLANIKRGDCCKIISKYVKDLQYQEVEQKSQHDN